jgi:PKD repeat protein
MTDRSGIKGRLRSLTAGIGSLALAATCLVAVSPSAGAATTEVPPETVTADALPTWQINGVVYSQAVVGNTVYVTGSFTRARPPGVAAGGAGEVTANNIFAYDLTTGNRVTSFNHSLNGQGLVIRRSPDGTRIYVGGDFTTVDGVARGHVAAFDTRTNALVSGWSPKVSGQVRGLGITGGTVYVGGNFTSAGGATRTRLAAFQTSTGAMTSWAPAATGGYVWTMTMSPGDGKVLVGGSFTQLSGSAAYGMGAIHASTAATLPWAATSKIRTAGSYGAITSLKTDGNLVYGGGYAFGAGARFEGTFGLDPSSGAISWVNDCLGDTYDIATQGPVLYAVSHYHDCSAVDAFPDTNPRSRWQKATAQYSTATNVTTRNDAYGWDFRGYSYARMLSWWPDLAFGSYTSAGQAAWAVDTAGDYVLLGGEFPRVNGVAQQGLTRMVKGTTAPNARGPRYYSTVPETTAVSLQAGTVRVTWGSAWDQDDENLKYEVLRDGNKWVHSIVAPSNFWTLPRLGFIDKDVIAGSTHSYQVRITDPDGNVQWSPKSNVVTVGTGAASAYADLVTRDGAAHLWRLGEPSGATGLDWAGFDDVTLSGGFTRGVAGALAADPDRASRFNGSSGFAATSAPVAGPNVFSVEAWFRTTSTSGGKIVGFGDRNTGTSSNYDRHVYMDAQGKVWFGVWNSASYTVGTAQALNDGKWHQVVGTMDASGATLYVDGKLVGKNTGTSVAQSYNGYWRIGGDTSWSGNAYFNGDIDEVAIYPRVLTQQNVTQHLQVGQGLVVNQPPTASFTHSESGLTVSVNGSGSSDPDGTIASYSWNWGDASPRASGATATHTYGVAGTYTVSLTVTDDKGATGTVSHDVTVAAAANLPPTASFTHSESGLTVSVNGSGSSDPDGTVKSYTWKWGDSTADGTGITATHTFAQAGTYAIELTVTDDKGASASKSATVSVSVERVFARDDFGRTVVNGWGTADVGGTWTQGGQAARWSVSDGAGRVSLNGGDGYTAYLGGSSALDTEISAVLSTNRVPTGGGQYFALLSRRIAANTDYRVKLRLNADGSVSVYLTRTVSNSETVLVWDDTLPGLTYTSGDRLKIRLQTIGTSPTTVRAKVWHADTLEPTAWALSGTDSTAALQAAGSMGLYSYVSGSATNAPIEYSVDQFWAGSPRS